MLATPFSLRSNVAPRSHPGAACPVYRTENALFCSCRVFQYLTMQVKEMCIRDSFQAAPYRLRPRSALQARRSAPPVRRTDTARPVSYTHLDVYKRQPESRHICPRAIPAPPRAQPRARLRSAVQSRRGLPRPPPPAGLRRPAGRRRCV